MPSDSPFTFPAQGTLDTSPLARLYKSTSSTYKFYWCLALLDMLKENKTSFPMDELVIRMLWYACFPVNVCRLELGPNDSLLDLAKELSENLKSRTPALDLIRSFVRNNSIFAKKVSRLKLMVPYRFLSPWLGSSDSGPYIRHISQTFTNNCLYSIGADLTITLNPNWLDYCYRNWVLLRDYTLWHLTQYLQMRNPNVPNISGKLVMPEKRDPMTAQHKWWDMILGMNPMKCIYSGTMLHAGEYELDHFIPWSFVTHNRLWNLVPVNQSVNSTKSDKLPDLNHYIHELAHIQHQALRIYFNGSSKRDRLFEDFLDLNLQEPVLKTISEENYREALRVNMTPMIEIASNRGFEKNWIYHP